MNISIKSQWFSSTIQDSSLMYLSPTEKTQTSQLETGNHPNQWFDSSGNLFKQVRFLGQYHPVSNRSAAITIL